jgi:hypothetical protein
MRLINKDTPNIVEKLNNTKETLELLSKVNWWYMHDHQRWKGISVNGDIEIYDLFLHAQDRAYSVPELYEWIEGCDLNFVAFAENPHHYLPENLVGDPHLLSIIKKQSVRNQQAIAELITGIIRNHSFYISNRESCTAQPEDLQNVPYFFDNCLSGPALARAMEAIPAGNLMDINLSNNTKVRLAPQRFTRAIVSLIDGNTPLEDIFTRIAQQQNNSVNNEALLEDFRPVYQKLVDHSLLLLRHKSIPLYPATAMLEQRVSRL